MYKLPYFTEEDDEVVKQFVRDYPFALIAGCSASGEPVASQVPVFIDEKDGKLLLTGHIMRNTDHHKAFVQNPNVLAVFTGPHVYVSASWYDNPKQASTWNYVSVHAKGKIRFVENEALIEVLKRTTKHYENNPDSGSNFEDLSPEYIQRLIPAIVAFEIEVTQLSNVFKLSQNRDEKSYDNIIGKLEQQAGDGARIAEMMKQRKAQVFK